MKNVITYLKTLWGAWGNLLSNDVRHDRRLTRGVLCFLGKLARRIYSFGCSQDILGAPQSLHSSPSGLNAKTEQKGKMEQKGEMSTSCLLLNSYLPLTCPLFASLSLVSRQSDLDTYAAGKTNNASGARVAQEWMKYAAVFVMLFSIGSGNVWGADTYKLTAVTSVSAGNKYVFVESGNALTNATASSGRLQSTTTFKTTELLGTETYVWTLESTTGGFLMKNLSLASNQYLRNTQTDGTNLGFSTSSATQNVWAFSFNDGKATIAVTADNDKVRYIGNNGSDYYKAYVAPADANSHLFTVYRLDLEVTETYTVTWMSNGSQVRKDTDVPSGTAKTPPTISPLPCGDKLMGWTDAAGGAYVHGTSNLYTGATITITGDVVLYAVFADEE